MFLKWFDTTEVEAFAASLTNEFIERVPPDSLMQAARGSKARLAESTDLLLKRVGNFASGRRLNILKRARLANSLKWRLHEAGYEKSLIDDLTLSVARKVATTKYSVPTRGIGDAGPK